jgi:transposase
LIVDTWRLGHVSPEEAIPGGKREAIALVASSGRTVTEVARELGISSEGLRGWVKKANGAGQAAAGASVTVGSWLDTAEREGLKRLRNLAADQAKRLRR